MLGQARGEAASYRRVENSGVLRSSIALWLSVNTLSREYLFLSGGLCNRREQKLCTTVPITKKYFPFRGKHGIK